MSSRGESKSQKTVAVEKIRFLKRKESNWTIRNKAGPHSKKSSVALGFLIRDLLLLANNLSEVKKILNSGTVKVNGIIRKDYKFSVGLFDIIGFVSGKKMYRVVLDSNGRIKPVEMDSGLELEKVSKVLKKKVSKKGVIELTTDDGFVLKQGKEPVMVSDSLKLGLPDKKIVKHFPFSVDNIALIIGGKHAGAVGTIKEISESSMHKPKLVKLHTGQGELITLEKYVCVVGDKKTASQMCLEGFDNE